MEGRVPSQQDVPYRKNDDNKRFTHHTNDSNDWLIEKRKPEPKKFVLLSLKSNNGEETKKQECEKLGKDFIQKENEKEKDVWNDSIMTTKVENASFLHPLACLQRNSESASVSGSVSASASGPKLFVGNPTENKKNVGSTNDRTTTGSNKYKPLEREQKQDARQPTTEQQDPLARRKTVASSKLRVDCGKGMPPAFVLREQWKMARYAYCFSEINPDRMDPPPEPTWSEFERAASRYVRYLAGRSIQTDYNNYPFLSTRLFDRDCGFSGALASCVDAAYDLTSPPPS